MRPRDLLAATLALGVLTGLAVASDDALMKQAQELFEPIPLKPPPIKGVTSTPALVELGNRFRGSLLVAGNSAFALMWGIGGIVGPPLAGSSMQAAGPVGLVGVIAGLSLVLVAFALWRSATRRA